MNSLKAVYAGGRVVTGITHGDAFGHLPPEDREGNDFLIGDWCPDTGGFEAGGQIFFTKKILLVRHGQPRDGNDPDLTDHGLDEVGLLGAFLLHEWIACGIFCSHAHRCVQTAGCLNMFLLDERGVTRDGRLAEGSDDPADILTFLGTLPQKSIIVSHSPFIRSVVELIAPGTGRDVPLPFASMTLIDNNQVIYVGKGLPQ